MSLQPFPLPEDMVFFFRLSRITEKKKNKKERVSLFFQNGDHEITPMQHFMDGNVNPMTRFHGHPEGRGTVRRRSDGRG